MLAYGLPRNKDVQWPDKLDGWTYALKSSRMRDPGKGKVIRSNFKHPLIKRKMRRYWKRKERAIGKTMCLDYNLNDIDEIAV